MFSSSPFNGDISGWNVSQVRDMCLMFNGSQFMGDVSQWNPIHAFGIKYMFVNCAAPIPYWGKIDNFKDRKNAIIEFPCNKEKENLEHNIKVLDNKKNTLKI